MKLSLAIALTGLIALASCGGGGGRGWLPSPVDNAVHDNLAVAWTQPPMYEPEVEGEPPAPLDLSKDIRLYEVVCYDNAAQLEQWNHVPFADNEIRTEYPLVIAYVSGVDGAGVPIQDVDIDLTRLAGIVLPEGVYISVRSQSQDNAFSAFAAGMYPEEGKK